jgi:hypothetical protein
VSGRGSGLVGLAVERVTLYCRPAGYPTETGYCQLPTPPRRAYHAWTSTSGLPIAPGTISDRTTPAVQRSANCRLRACPSSSIGYALGHEAEPLNAASRAPRLRRPGLTHTGPNRIAPSGGDPERRLRSAVPRRYERCKGRPPPGCPEPKTTTK